MSRKCEWRENFFNFHLSVVQIRDGSRVIEPTKKASWPNKWNVHIKLQKKKIAHGLDDPSDGLHDPPLERITDCNAAFKLFILCHNVSNSLRCNWPMHCLNFVQSVNKLLHKSLIWYPAESQGYMWAFLMGGFLTSLMISPIVTCAWRLGSVTCQNSQRGFGKRCL